MKIQVQKASSCIVRVGPVTRSDPDAELHIVHKVDGEWTRYSRTYIEGKKAFKFPDLPEGEYHIAVFGDKIAGAATTGGHEMPFPFDVFLDAPVDHSKDYRRIDIPAGMPVENSLKHAIKQSINSTKH